MERYGLSLTLQGTDKVCKMKAMSVNKTFTQASGCITMLVESVNN